MFETESAQPGPAHFAHQNPYPRSQAATPLSTNSALPKKARSQILNFIFGPF
jgi:hypothetical protein